MGRKKGAMDVLLTIYKSRPDLQSAFPEVNKGDYKRLLGWAVTCGVTIDPAKESLDPVFSDLVELIKPLRYAENLVNQNILKNMYGDKFIFDIDERDEMYQFSAAHPSSHTSDPVAEYFKIGEIIVDCLVDVLDDIDYNVNKIHSFLDFACGYGRSIRFLVHRIPKDKITVADVDKSAVDFCKNTFGVKGFYSVMDPEKLYHNDKYDIIYVVSLF